MFEKNKSAKFPPQIDFNGQPIGAETTSVTPEKVKRTGDFLGRIADLGVTVSDSARPFLEDPRTRDAAARVADAAVTGATDQFRGGDGKVKKRKILGAALRPTRTARRATTGAAAGAFKEGREAAEDVSRGAVASAFGTGEGDVFPAALPDSTHPNPASTEWIPIIEDPPKPKAEKAFKGLFGRSKSAGGEPAPITPAPRLSESPWGSSPSNPWETTPVRIPSDPFAESAPSRPEPRDPFAVSAPPLN